MARGIEGRVFFRDERDRADFVRRLAALAQAGAVTVYAWALLPNHVHLLVRSGHRPLSRTMRSLLTGYAGAFNRRHHRKGHLFQNRYKSVVVEEEPYFLELVRYLHLNPLRTGIVQDLRALDRYPWSGHAALVGRGTIPWQDTRTVLARFAPTRRRAQAGYRAFIAEGAGQGRRPDLQGGGLLRSAGGWAAVQALRRGRERWAADERILGSSAFVEAIQREATPLAQRVAGNTPQAALPALLARCAAVWGVTPAEVASGSRRRVVAHARAVASCLAVRALGLPMPAVARALGISPTVVRAGVARGTALLAERGLAVSELLPPRKRKPR
jgi:REP element-mobilizing transposase RayT